MNLPNHRRVLRWTKRLAIGFSGLLLLIVLLLLLLLQTQPGRNLIRDVATSQTNAAIPGAIEIDAIDQLNFSGVEITGIRISDPRKKTVARIGRIVVHPNWSGILNGKIELDRVVVEDVWADAKNVDQSAHGLLAAFVDPDAPSAPPSNTPPPEVVIHQIRLEKIHADLPPLPQLGQIQATLHSLKGALSLNSGIPAGQIDVLRMAAHRGQEELLTLSGNATVPIGKSPANATVRISAGTIQIAGTATAQLPVHPGWELAPASLQLGITGVTAAQLANTLNDPSLKDAFEGDVELNLAAKGKNGRFDVQGAVISDAGMIRFDELQIREKQIQLQVSTDGFDLNALRKDLPNYRIATRLKVETNGMPSNPVRFVLHVDQSKINNIPLPKVDASGEYWGDSVKNFDLAIHERHGRIDAQGNLSFTDASELNTQINLQSPLVQRLGNIAGQHIEGRLTATANVRRQLSGHITTSGNLMLHDFAYSVETKTASKTASNNITLKKMTAEFDASGAPPMLSGTLTGQILGLVHGKNQLDDAHLRVSGTPENVTLTLDAKGGIGPVDEDGKRPKKKSARLALKAKVERRGTSTLISGRGTGHLQGRPLQFDLAQTEVTDSGAFNSDGLNLTFAGQRLKVNGQLSPNKPSDGLVVVDFGPLKLNGIPEVIAIHPDLTGTVEGQVRIRGTSHIPVVSLKVTGHQLGLTGRPLIDAAIDASLDAQEGTARVTASLSNPKGLRVTATGSATFKGGARWTRRIHLAEIDSTFNITALSSDILTPYFPELILPFDVTTDTQIHAHGSLKDPRLELRTEADLRQPDKAPVTVLLRASYLAGTLDADLQVTDDSGVWASLDAGLFLPGPAPAVSQLGAAFAHAAPDGTWHLNMDVAKRSLQDIPIMGAFIDVAALPSVETQLRVVATHSGEEEPDVHMVFQANQTAPLAVKGCQASDLVLRATFDHQNTENRLTVTGTQKNQELLLLEASAPLAVQPVLKGAPLQPGPVDFILDTKRIKLSDVPFVCVVARGEIDGSASGNDVLGTYPQVTAQLRARSFSLGSNETVDIEIDTTALAEELMLSGQIRSSDDSNTLLGHLSAHMPMRFADGKLAVDDNVPIDVKLNLNRLPVAPLLPPKGPVSYARGFLNGKMKASGNLDAPQIHGRMALQDMAFTSTSLAQPLRGVQGVLIFNGRQIEVSHFEAHDRDGTLTLKGAVDVTDMERIHGKMHITADDFPLRQRGEVVAVTNFDAVAESTITDEKTDARLTLNDVDTWLESVAIRTGIDLAAHEEFVIDGMAAPGSALAEKMSKDKAESAEDIAHNGASDDTDGGVITIIIEGEKNFWVKREDFAVKLNTILKTEIVDDDVRVTGEVTIHRGYLQLLGREFDLAPESTVRFTGSNPPNPTLALAADYNTRGGSIVGVKIGGRADAPEIRFLLDGDEVDAGIAMQEIFGADDATTSTDASTQAQSFVSGLTAGVLATTARRELGAAAPIIMIDPAETAGEGRVRAGFELDSIVPKFLRPIVTGVYLEGIVERESEGESGAETEFGALLELYFPKKFFTAAQYGPGNTWSVDFGWQL